jgi:hypothetical protein
MPPISVPVDDHESLKDKHNTYLSIFVPIGTRKNWAWNLKMDLQTGGTGRESLKSPALVAGKKTNGKSQFKYQVTGI